MQRGIVMEITTQSIVVMTSEGQFKQIAKHGRSCQIGEEIAFVESYSRPRMNRFIRQPFAIAAASVFFLVILAALSIFGEGTSPRVAAYVTMDINPSIEVGIDNNENVIEIRGINEDGVKLLGNLDFEGLTLEAFSEQLVQRIEQGHYLDSGEANILITSTVVAEAPKEYESELAEKVKLKVIDAIKRTHTAPNDQIVVTAISAPKEVREKAIEQGVSTGKKAIQLLTQKNQKSTSDKELKGKSIKQMIKDNGGVENILPQDSKGTKEELKSLMKELNNRKKENNQQEDNPQEDKQKDKQKDEQKDKQKDEQKDEHGDEQGDNSKGKQDEDKKDGLIDLEEKVILKREKQKDQKNEKSQKENMD
jgi:hypothetical protein